MITRMTKYTLLCARTYSEELIGSLQEMGVMDIRRSNRPVDEHSSALMDRALQLKYTMSGEELKKELAASKAREKELDMERRRSIQWGSFDSRLLENLQNDGFTLHFHSVAEKKFLSQWENEVPLERIASDGKNVFFVTVEEKGREFNCLPGEIARPRCIDEIDAEISGEHIAQQEIEKKKMALAAQKPEFQREYNAVMAELDAYLAAESTAAWDKADNADDLQGVLAIYEGYAPADIKAAVEERLDGMPLFYISEEAKGDDTPIRLHNRWFARQFEVFTGMYGWPEYGEFDPTPILAPFYLLFFSMCMGDAGYGLLLMAIALILGKKASGSGLGKMHNLIFLLGAGTAVVGTLLGTFFGINLFNATWVPQWLKNCMLVEGNIGKIAGFDPQIILSLAIGIFHICLAMVVKTACFTSHYGFKNSVSTWGWTLLVVGGVIVASLAIGGILGGEALKWTIIVIGAVSALGIFVFNTPGRNPLVNIGSGLWDAYSTVSGLLSDTLSYVRLYALGLAGGMLGNVFNSLATMILGDFTWWRWIPFVLLLLVGHGLNIALSCLGAFVHPLRLSFVEYFKNSGYQGRGIQYKPLSKETNN